MSFPSVKSYLEDFYDHPSDHRRSVPNNLHGFFEVYATHWERKAEKLLVYGGRGSIAQLISASRFVNHVTYASYNEETHDEIEKWRSGSAESHDWSPYFKYVVNRLEETHGDEAWKEREANLRKQVVETTWSDKFETIIKPEWNNQFDVVITQYYLEAVCHSYDEYVQAITLATDALKQGGYFIMRGVEQQSFYECEDEKYHSLSITLDQMKTALDSAGLNIVELKRDFPRGAKDDMKGRSFIVAMKR
jgi:nicotinamide N-methyltransferase/methyltransferase